VSSKFRLLPDAEIAAADYLEWWMGRASPRTAAPTAHLSQLPLPATVRTKQKQKSWGGKNGFFSEFRVLYTGSVG
jgi:hypothetical protein